MKQTTNQLMMIRPVAFRKNEETAENNFFQQDIEGTPEEINLAAQNEFDGLVQKLRDYGVKVHVFDDIAENNSPDSVFPNNWVSFHEEKTAILYPLFAVNRRVERREELICQIGDTEYVIIIIVSDYIGNEDDNKYLEGTGSLVLDRGNKKVYCGLSERSHESLVHEFSNDQGYTPIVFVANQTVNGMRKPIYHTNVMLSIAETFAVVCLESIDDIDQRNIVIQNLTNDGKEIIEISERQMHSFAGNMLQVESENGSKAMVMSEQAYSSLTESQIVSIESHCDILFSDLTTIETLGGGSARCMMAEVFL
ncbi:citrulline utilization hydrolase CtlX [Brumimicrobium mesophilum]|uniref:citrulline utilization hydrolase CtlX n=1 Tax=Brumimicrobium mesophilum TaxID=392717 RepID=UPI000D142324|nr:arginine deiminase-related protein [Brumimicrobium mesophilum]